MPEALATVVGMALFGLFAARPLPLFFIALAALLGVALLIARSAYKEHSLGKVCGWTPVPHRIGRWCVAGFLGGLLFALYYRWNYCLPLIPVSLTYVVIPAALIGAAEETVFRGYLQSRIRMGGLLLAPLLAASGHTLYKCALFLLPAEASTVNLAVLAAVTFAAGWLIGLIRQQAGSVLPAVIAHALFDILAYGDRISMPWWVWR